MQVTDICASCFTTRKAGPGRGADGGALDVVDRSRRFFKTSSCPGGAARWGWSLVTGLTARPGPPNVLQRALTDLSNSAGFIVGKNDRTIRDRGGNPRSKKIHHSPVDSDSVHRSPSVDVMHHLECQRAVARPLRRSNPLSQREYLCDSVPDPS